MHETPYRREPGYAERYRDHRFRSGSGAGTDRRERRALRTLLRNCAVAPGPWLDAPAGAGRMSDELPGSVVQLDRDPAMLVAAGPGRPRVCASVHALPFANRTFAGVLCHRLLQHLPGPPERATVLHELARVSRGVVVLSFFDRCSWQHLRRTVRRWFGKTRSGRTAIGRGQFLAELRAAGLDPIAVLPLRLRFVGEQTLVACSTRHQPASDSSAPGPAR